MKTLNIYITALVILNVTFSYAQEKRAVEKFDNYAYTDAIDSYENLVKKGATSEDIYKNLGNANYFNADYAKASEWYEKLFNLDSTNIDAEYLYKYAQTLKSLKKYEASDEWMRKFEKAKKNDYRAKKFISSKNYLEKIKENSGRHTMNNISVNSATSDFAPSFNGQQLVFSTARDTGIASRNIHQWNKQSFLNLYTITVSEDTIYSNLSKLSKELNAKTHESSTAFTKDGKTLYFTRNNSYNGNFSRDEDGVSRLKIYKATLVDEDWGNIIELPFNGDNYSVAHPALNADESKLYFASDMPGTLGMSDIFVVDILADGGYGTPKNLGNKINTESRETFPFVTETGILYFASDGYPGLGGLDVYAINLAYLQKGVIQNIGMPINSEEDDFSFIINENNKKGYFASNRSGGIGSDDIYSFTETKPLDFDCTTKISGIIKDKKTNEVLTDARLVILDMAGNTVTKGISDSNGAFNLKTKCKDGNYEIIASLTDYDENKMPFLIADLEDLDNLEVLLSSSLAEMSAGNDLAKALNLERIYFDLNKSYIKRDAKVVLEKVVAYMKQFPESKVQVGSHTDSRANNDYNLKLSNKRAKATVKHLISQGISKDRLTYEGFGETMLINECGDSSKCNEAKHQLNRRSEFIVLE